jgi:photosystem II stability/assembly factor-like uncharacterized protein
MNGLPMNKIKRICTFVFLPIVFLSILACTQSSDDSKRPVFKKSIARKHLFSIETFGTEKVWIVGFEGIIHHSSDNGKNWTIQTSPVQEDLYNVCFVNDQTGWIVGKHGTILKTTNGGETWKELKKATDRRLFDVHFIDENTGWAVGTMGTIIHTEDGGESWAIQGWNEDRYYNSIYFADAKKGWIVGEYSTMYMTENGGKTWSPMKCKDIEPEDPPDDFPPPPAHLYGMYVMDAHTGGVTGMDGIIIKTEDGGKSWKRLTPKTDFTLYQVKVAGENGWAIGEKGAFMVSRDNGNTWQKDMSALRTRFWLRDIVFSDPNKGWIVGAGGTIIQTEDGGKSWRGLSGRFIK